LCISHFVLIPSEKKEVEITLFPFKTVTIDYVFQPDGTRDLENPSCKRGTIKLSARFESGKSQNSLKFTLLSDKPGSSELVLEQINEKINFSMAGTTYGKNGYSDGGVWDFDSAKEAPAKGYGSSDRTPLIRHVYFVKTNEGCYAKFIVKSIDEDTQTPPADKRK
jgi:hypothetical protein